MCFLCDLFCTHDLVIFKLFRIQRNSDSPHFHHSCLGIENLLEGKFFYLKSCCRQPEIFYSWYQLPEPLFNNLIWKWRSVLKRYSDTGTSKPCSMAVTKRSAMLHQPPTCQGCACLFIWLCCVALCWPLLLAAAHAVTC